MNLPGQAVSQEVFMMAFITVSVLFVFFIVLLLSTPWRDKNSRL